MENFENMAGNGTVIYPAILLIAIAGSFFFYNRMSLGQTLQSALVWGMIFLGAVAIYGMWEQLAGQLNPRAAQISATEITVPRERDGHFYLTVEINGTDIEFLVDTGASDLVLTKEDAARVGIDVDNLAFLGRANTANGQVPIARTRLDVVKLGEFTDRNILASVNGGPMFGSLLGMTYLGRFESIEIGQDELTLRR